jgi:Cys-tRNA(Pro)/Cys-tRNA(Cys) deacylase
MLPPAEAERLTGYHVGGISPLGQKKRAPSFIERASLAHETILVNGGRRGLQIEIAPSDLVTALSAKAADLC